MELDLLIAETEAAIKAKVDGLQFRPGKFSVWLKFVRLTYIDGVHTEEVMAPPVKQIFTASDPGELIHQLADNLLLNIFGSEIRTVSDMPNLILKVLDKKVTVALPGAPPLDQPEQIYVKATVYEYSPGLWEQLFGRRRPNESAD